MKKEKPEGKVLAVAVKNQKCTDKKCHIHGRLSIRGRTFQGIVTKKMESRVLIEFERMIYVKKYERYKKSKTKIHAHLPGCMSDNIRIGDLIKVQECRPLSKIIHFAVVEKIKDKDEGGNGK